MAPAAPFVFESTKRGFYEALYTLSVRTKYCEEYFYAGCPYGLPEALNHSHNRCGRLGLCRPDRATFRAVIEQRRNDPRLCS